MKSHWKRNSQKSTLFNQLQLEASRPEVDVFISFHSRERNLKKHNFQMNFFLIDWTSKSLNLPKRPLIGEKSSINKTKLSHFTFGIHFEMKNATKYIQENKVSFNYILLLNLCIFQSPKSFFFCEPKFGQLSNVYIYTKPS